MQIPAKLWFQIERGKARLNQLAEMYGRGDRRVLAYDRKLQKKIVEAQRGMTAC